MKLAILGTRGIPANYGGFETFAEELRTRLAARGHDVTVYCRSNNISYPHKTYKGVKLAILPTIGTKHLDTWCIHFYPYFTRCSGSTSFSCATQQTRSSGSCPGSAVRRW